MKIELIYFKDSGKYYNNAEYEPKAKEYWNILAEIRELQYQKKLPGLIEGAFFPYIHTVINEVPYLIVWNPQYRPNN